MLARLHRYFLIVTVEEHSIIGGLGSAIAEYKTTLLNTPPQLLMGLTDKFVKAGDYKYLLEKYGLTAPQIAGKIIDRLSNRHLESIILLKVKVYL